MAEKVKAVGHVVQVIGPVLDIQFEAGHLPAIYNAVRITSEGYNLPEPLDVTVEVQQHLGEGRVRAVAMEPTEGMVRGMKAFDTGAGITRAGGAGDAGPRDERARQTCRSARPGEQRQALSDSPSGAETGRSVHHAGNVRDRNQGRRPDRAVPEGRQDRIVRRRGRRQDGFDYGIDSQRRDEARRRFGVRRRGRAHP